MLVSELCGCQQCEGISVPGSIKNRSGQCPRCNCSDEKPQEELNSPSVDLQKRSFYTFLVDVISIIAFFFFWMFQVWLYVFSIIFYYGVKLWNADKEVQVMAGLLVLLMILSITLKVLFSPLHIIEITSRKTQEKVTTFEEQDCHLCPNEEIPVVMSPPAKIPLETLVEKKPETPKLQVRIEPSGDVISGEYESNNPQHMKLCLKDKKVRSEDPKNNSVKTIKMTLSDGKGKTLFEESTNFYICEKDGVPPTIVLTTAPIPINNY